MNGQTVESSIELTFTQGNGRYIFSWKNAFIILVLTKRISQKNLKFIEKYLNEQNTKKLLKVLKI